MDTEAHAYITYTLFIHIPCEIRVSQLVCILAGQKPTELLVFVAMAHFGLLLLIADLSILLSMDLLKKLFFSK